MNHQPTGDSLVTSPEVARAMPDLSFEAIHLWFGLTYANYLVLPRTLLQSMPDEWQERFVRCLYELDDAMGHVEQASSYRVNAVDPITGRFVKDPVPHYNRGRARVRQETN